MAPGLHAVGTASLVVYSIVMTVLLSTGELKIKGKDGADGVVGEDGTNGIAGASGANGADGAVGSDNFEWGYNASQIDGNFQTTVSATNGFYLNNYAAKIVDTNGTSVTVYGDRTSSTASYIDIRVGTTTTNATFRMKRYSTQSMTQFETVEGGKIKFQDVCRFVNGVGYTSAPLWTEFKQGTVSLTSPGPVQSPWTTVPDATLRYEYVYGGGTRYFVWIHVPYMHGACTNSSTAKWALPAAITPLFKAVSHMMSGTHTTNHMVNACITPDGFLHVGGGLDCENDVFPTGADCGFTAASFAIRMHTFPS